MSAVVSGEVCSQCSQCLSYSSYCTYYGWIEYPAEGKSKQGTETGHDYSSTSENVYGEAANISPVRYFLQIATVVHYENA